MLFEHERRNELTKASSDASLRNQRPRAGFVVCCGAALSAFRALDRTCVLTLIHYWRNESYRMLSIWPTIICQENQVIKIKTGLSTLLRCISATMPKFLHLPADICVKIRRLCRSAMSQTDNPEESSALLSGFRGGVVQNRRRTQLAHPSRLRRDDGLFDWRCKFSDFHWDYEKRIFTIN